VDHDKLSRRRVDNVREVRVDLNAVNDTSLHHLIQRLPHVLSIACEARARDIFCVSCVTVNMTQINTTNIILICMCIISNRSRTRLVKETRVCIFKCLQVRMKLRDWSRRCRSEPGDGLRREAGIGMDPLGLLRGAGSAGTLLWALLALCA